MTEAASKILQIGVFNYEKKTQSISAGKIMPIPESSLIALGEEISFGGGNQFPQYE